MEKHARGSLARSNREVRVAEKEKRKVPKENRYCFVSSNLETRLIHLFIHPCGYKHVLVFWLRK